MALNPFDQQLEDAEREAAALAAALEVATAEIEWFEGTSRDELLEQLEELRSEVAAQSAALERMDAKIARAEKVFRTLTASMGTLWNPANWLSARQRAYRTQAQKLGESLRQARQAQSKAKNRLAAARRSECDKTAEIEKYGEFDLSALNVERSDLDRRLTSHRLQVETILSKKLEVDAAIEPIIGQMREIDRQRSEAAANMERARKFERELSSASNSYERAMVHQKCGREFGIDRPGQVISRNENELRRLERSHEKLEARARAVANKVARDVRRLVIDGMNLCYEGDRFIGLDALTVLVPALADRYEVVVVFDASIRGALKMGDADVRDALGEKALVHIVATRIKADETVLDLAGADKATFVVSNDRFVEFWDKPAQRDGRVIRHEIVDGRILIHDLGVSESYGG